MPSRTAVFIVVGMLQLLLVSPCLADYWYQHYARAEEAIANEHWDVAIEELNQALERRDEPGARVRTYGMKVVDYLPYFKLGIAYFHLDHLDGAAEAFATERSFGVITDLPEDLALLEYFEEQIRVRRQQIADREKERIAAVVNAGLSEATRFKEDGHYDEAVKQLSRVLSVDPDHQGAQRMLAEIRRLIAAEEEAEIAASQARSDLERARSLVAQGRLLDALSSVRQSLAAFETDEASSLRSEIEAALAARSDPIPSPVPTPPKAPKTTARDERADKIRSWLQNAETANAAGRFDDAIVAANRVLALDSTNRRAAAVLVNAYREIGRGLLEQGQLMPPVIRFTDLRHDRGREEPVEILRVPQFRLQGVVIDDGPVRIDWLQPEGISVAVEVQEHAGVTISEFGLNCSVKPGPTEFTVQATDQDGQSTVATYRVEYRRPWHRSPWFVGAVLLILGCAVGAWMWRRQARRREMLQRRFNPYIAGAPVRDEAMFFGRDELMNRILRTIHNNSVLIFGERRIGKTSLQHQLKRRLEVADDPDFSFFAVFIDLQGVPEERFFATIATEIRQELGATLGWQDVDAKVREAESFGYRDLVRDLRSTIAALQEQSKRRVRVVLLIDEVDELNAYDQRVSQRLRSLFMKSFAESLVAVVSGVSIKRRWEREGSPWYNFFEEIEMQHIDRASAQALIEGPMGDVFRIDDGVVERIIALSSCKPYLVQRLCMAVVNDLHARGGRRVRIEDVDRVADSIRELTET